VGPIKVAPPYAATPTEQRFIAELNPHEPNHWKLKSIRNGFYKNLVRHLSLVQNNRCAYCGKRLLVTSLHSVDHVAHKDKYRDFIFETANLVLACLLCNGFTKKGEEDVVSPYNAIYSLCDFTIIHPIKDGDNISDHLVYLGSIPQWKTPKGKRTIELFKLDSENLLLDNAEERDANLVQAARLNYPVLTSLLEAALRTLGK
jgi:uncharacterized protein (TIGR02646 family)